MGNLPNITKNLLIINALAFVTMYIVKGSMGKEPAVSGGRKRSEGDLGISEYGM